MKLSQEHKELLAEAAHSSMWPAIEAYCAIIVQNHAEAVMAVDLSKGSRELFHQKARLDGAKSLAKALTKDSIKRATKTE